MIVWFAPRAGRRRLGIGTRFSAQWPDDAQAAKLVGMAPMPSARVVGDDGERYEVRKTRFGKEKTGPALSDDARTHRATAGIVVGFGCFIHGQQTAAVDFPGTRRHG